MVGLFPALAIIFVIRLAYSYFKLYKAEKQYDRVLKLGRRSGEYGEWEEEVESMFSNLYLLASKIRTNWILLGLFAVPVIIFNLGGL